MTVVRAVACMAAFLLLFWAYIGARVATSDKNPKVWGYYLGVPCSMVAGLLLWLALSI